MGDISKVSLVHCPQCEATLPEILDSSVYQCGGCGAVFQAKKKGNLESGKELERSSEENVRVYSETSESLLGESEDLEGKGKVPDTTVERFRNDSKKGVSNREFEVEIVDFGESEHGNLNLNTKVNSLITHVDNAYGLRKTGRVFEHNQRDLMEDGRFGTRQGYFNEMRCSSSNYGGEGRSKHCLESSYKREIARSVEEVEPDREELLRKLEELKDQLRRVENNSNKFHEKHPTGHRGMPLEAYVESEDYFRGHPSTFRQVPREVVAPYKHVAAEAPCFNRYHEPFAPHHRSDVSSHDYHNSIHGSHYVPRYEHPLESQMFCRPSQRIQGHPHYTGHEIDHFETHPYDRSLCHNSCSSYSCYDRQLEVRPQIPPSAFPNRKFHHVPTMSDPYHHEQELSPPVPPSAFPSRMFNHVPTKSDPYHHEQELLPQVPQSPFSNRKFHHVPTKSDPYHHEQELLTQVPPSPFFNRKFHHVPTKSDPFHHDEEVSSQVSPSAFSNRKFHHVSTKSDPYHHDEEVSSQVSSSAFSNRKFHHIPTKSDPYHQDEEVSSQVSPSAFSNRKFHHVPTKSDPYHNEQEVSPQVPPSAFSNRKFHHVPSKSDPFHHEHHDSFDSHSYNSRLINTPPSGSNKPQSHTRWPSDLNLERNTSPRPQTAVLSKEHHCRPVANGAPFVTCRNCFELLKLPKKVRIQMGEWQMTCAACSTVLSFAFVDEKLTSVDPSAKETNPEITDSINEPMDSINENMDSINEASHGYLKRDNVSYCSEDYANAGFDFQAMDRDPSFSSTSHSLSSRKSEETHNIQSVSYTTSEDERSSDDIATRQEVSYSAEPPAKSDDSSVPPGSPPQDFSDCTSKYRAVNQHEIGNLSMRSDEDKFMTIKNTLEKISLRESVATELELSPNGCGNARLSKHGSEKSQEDDELKGKKGDSFFAGFLKKSFRSNHSIENTKKNVMVNGHLIPDKLLKKAEKLAGPVYPGQYWYDYRAGFWGVVGGPCLGIIPSSIEEFNYPMPENCAAGTTGVFVNGRELHQKDLELLSSRGLPTATDKSYVVDISGKVIDEDTGEEKVSLGKLAPTIEKVKHGFGMRPPKAVA
ncbi:hypothetical protein vseg_009391 [Gypsophila vaccaria]